MVYIDPFLISVDADADLLISTEKNIDNAKDSISQNELGDLPELIPVSSMGSYSEDWIGDVYNPYPVFKQEYQRGNQIDPVPNLARKGFFQQTFYLWTKSATPKYVTFDCRYKEGGVDENGKVYNPIVKPNEAKNLEKIDRIAQDRAIRNYKEIADKEIAEKQIDSESEKNSIYARVKRELQDKYENVTVPNDLANVINSVRFSILDYENLARKDENDDAANYIIIDPTKTKDSDPVVFGGRLCTSLTRDYYDYYIDSNGVYKETLFGNIINNNGNSIGRDSNLLYLEPSSQDIPRDLNKEPSCFNAGTHKGVMPLNMNVVNSLNFEKERAISPEEADFTTHPDDQSYGYLIKLIPNEPHKLVLSIYLEGWDRDNLDTTQEGSFDLSIRFRLCNRPGEYN